MASGFFLGGVAEGMADADKRALERERLATETGLRTRALDLTEARNRADMSINERAQTLSEKNAAREASRQGQAVVDKHIADTMAVVGETVKSAVAAGRDPETIRKAIAPLVESAVRLAPRAGRDPAALTAQVDAMLTAPTAVEAATVKGSAEAAAEIAKAKAMAPSAAEIATVKGGAEGVAEAAKRRALAAAGVEDENAGFKSKDEKVKAENSLRDDYLKQAQPFITIRDAKNRLESIEQTGAGDIALLFQFMKILDPGSTVREGEFATAGSVAGVPGQVEALRKQVVGGGRLADAARAQILSQSRQLYEAAALQHDRTATVFANIAKRSKLDPDNIVIDLSPTSKAKKPPPVGGKGDTPAPPAGFNLVP